MRIYVADSDSWEITGGWTESKGTASGATAGGARPQTAEIIKTFNERCPELTVTSNKDRADYAVILDHEGGKGALAHRNKIVVFNRDGDAIFSDSTRSLGNSVIDACAAINQNRMTVPTPTQLKDDRPHPDSATGITSADSTGKATLKPMDWINEDFAAVETAANGGDLRAQFEIGNRYYLGQKGATKDFSKALEWYHKAAAIGSPGAQVNLGLMYAHGQSVPQDYAQAMIWYRKAADQGLASAQSNIGALYFMGQGVAQDYTLARTWFTKAADQGLPSAQVSLGSLYRLGLGVVQDDAQAATWFRKAADQSDAAAENNLAALYYSGFGVPQDFGQALVWFRKAADQGDAGAQNNLGVLYENGQGVPRDLVQARIWYQKAADQGNANAKKRLVALAGRN